MDWETRAREAEAHLAEIQEALKEGLPLGVIEMIACTHPVPPIQEDIAWATKCVSDLQSA